MFLRGLELLSGRVGLVWIVGFREVLSWEAARRGCYSLVGVRLVIVIYLPSVAQITEW